MKDKPIVIGESDPDGCAACSAQVYPQNGYRNGTLYASYTAASFARKHDLADKHGVNLEGALTWAFEFEDQPYFAGFRSLATNGIDLPVLNVFRMFSQMGGQRLAVESDDAMPLERILQSGVRGEPDVSALASLDGQQALRPGLALPRRRRARPGRRRRAIAERPAARRPARPACSTSASTRSTATRSPPGSRWARRSSLRRSNIASSKRRGDSPD